MAEKLYSATPKSSSRGKIQHNECKRDPLQVFCRLRPITSETCMKVISSSLLSVIIPDNLRGNGKETQYMFQKVFKSDSTQKEIFEIVAQPLIDGLFNGKNALLFAYGVTGSGKTYTMTGDRSGAGIMPRCISTIFKIIEGCQAEQFLFKPDRLNGFEMQSYEDAHRDQVEFERKNRYYDKCVSAENSLASISDYDIPKMISTTPNYIYAIFVTYVEIYNNSVYDLLDDSSNKPIQNKIIREDATHHMYVHGVVEVEVKTAYEAMRLFFLGKKRKHMARTELNTDSSRSHSIFTIRLVQAPSPNHKNYPEINSFIKMSQLSLVDLAGSERSSRTKNTGLRLKETSKINNSLLNLRICLNTLRENQQLSSSQIVPYRDSKLTLLFKSFFEKDGQVRMIICINPDVEDYEETIQVLKFAEQTQSIQMITNVNNSNEKLAKSKENLAMANNYRFNYEMNPEPVLQYNENMDKLFSFERYPLLFLTDVRSNPPLTELTNYLQSRKIQVQEALEHFNEIQNKWRWNLSQVIRTQCHEKNLKLEKLEIELRDSKSNIKSLEQRVNDLERQKSEYKAALDLKNDEILNQKMELKRKDITINNLLADKEKEKKKLDSKLMRSAKLGQELELKLRHQRELYRHQIQDKENRLHLVKKIIGDEGSVITSTNELKVPTSTRTMATSTENLESPITEATNGFQDVHNARIPRVQRRRSRSLSTDRWLEHRVGFATELETVMQPNIKRSKTLTKLVNPKDVTKAASKYCLMSQEQDSDGDIETRLIKADIVQTTSGGAQVIFNDVETLKTDSPLSSKSNIRKRNALNKYDDNIEDKCSISIEGRKRSKL